MYREILGLAYIAGVFYAFFRLRSLFAVPLSRGIFTAVFLLVMLSLPAATVLSRDRGWEWLRPDSGFGYYLLTYVLYLPLTVLALDVLLGLNLLIKAVPADALRGSGYRVAGLVMALALPIVIVVAGRINYDHIRVSRYRIERPRKASTMEHLKVAVAADFHLTKKTGGSFIEDFLAKVNGLEPDIVLIPGDLVEDRGSTEEVAEFAAAFRKTKAKCGVWACPGNHDSFRRRGEGDFFEAAGIRMLADQVERIDDGFYLAGRKDDNSRSQKRVNELLEGAGGDLPVLLMQHRPSRLAELEGSRVDVQFSGHTHGGQLFPLNIGRKIQYGIAWGHKKVGTTDLFVTSGIRGWGPPIRTVGHSEIMLIDIEFTR